MKNKLKINTNQQNPNSRGGWEIIPKYGSQANKATRSGYGIELTVTTDYSTNWETKVPPKAFPFGYELTGAQQVTAHLPNGQVVDMVPDRTPGTGVYNITWRLPEITYKPEGLNETWKGRYFAMDPRTPDGEYDFSIVVRGAGKNQLRCTLKDSIYIYGDVWRDTNIKRNSK